MQTSDYMNDPDFRPETYWPQSRTAEQLLAGIKGKARRDIARLVLEEQGFTGLSAFLARQSLEEEDREAWGAIHPDFMGGEYLPSLETTEVEIARISLASVTGDQISVRAGFCDGKIRYAIADEYGSDFILPFEESARPLTLVELVRLINETRYPQDASPGGLVLGHLYYNYEAGGTTLGLRHFVSVESSFYPELAGYFQRVIDRWIADREAGVEEDEEGEECA